MRFGVNGRAKQQHEVLFELVADLAPLARLLSIIAARDVALEKAIDEDLDLVGEKVWWR